MRTLKTKNGKTNALVKSFLRKKSYWFCGNRELIEGIQKNNQSHVEKKISFQVQNTPIKLEFKNDELDELFCGPSHFFSSDKNSKKVFFFLFFFFFFINFNIKKKDL